MLFLTHVIILEIVKRHMDYQQYPRPVVYLSLIVFCTAFAILCQKLSALFFRRAKKILFED